MDQLLRRVKESTRPANKIMSQMDRSVDLRADIINSTACEKDESSHGGRAEEFSGPDLPEVFH